MGRKSKYESHVQPRLDEIAEWYQTMSEGEIADELGVSQTTFETYKKDHPELKEKLERAKKKLNGKMRSALKKRGLGFHESETEVVIKTENGKVTKTERIVDRYYPPDVGAIHLWLKNNDSDWRNDDEATLSLKRAKLELEKMKAEAEIW